jgi:AcrR family transcriptional regulator
MNKGPTPSSYNSPLRARQKEQTRVLILSAVATILHHADLQAVTTAEVARVAELTERTVYRHFSTRDDLLKAFWTWQLERSGGGNVIDPATIEELMSNIERLFSSLDADEGVIRAVLSSAEGRDVRKIANRARHEHMLGFVTRLHPDLSESDRHSIASGIVSVCSVPSWLFMRDNCGYDGQRAGEAAALAVWLILEGAKVLPAARQSPA